MQTQHSGAMIAFFVSEEAQNEIASYQSLLPDGADLTEPENFHLTLYYLSSDADNLRDIKTELLGELLYELRWQWGVKATTSGLARFSGEERDAVVLLVESPDLTDFHSWGIQWSVGHFDLERKHGFTPHITLGYIPKESSLNLPTITKQALNFEEVTVVWNDERITIPLKPRPFSVFKDANGDWRWLGITSSAYEDRDEEVITEKALNVDVERADTDLEYGPLNWWHIQGLNLGQCDFNMMLGRFLVESGTFANEIVAKAAAEHADDLAFSIEFLHPANEPDANGIYHNIIRVGRALLPKGKESNKFTNLLIAGGSTMTVDEKLKQLQELTGSQEAVVQLLDTSIAQQRKANEQQARFKEALSQKEFREGLEASVRQVVREELATWKQEQVTKEQGIESRLTEMEKGLKELKGEVPTGVGYRASQASDNVTSKAQTQQDDPFGAFFNGFFPQTPTA